MISRRKSMYLASASALGVSATIHADAAEAPAKKSAAPVPQPADWKDPMFAEPFIDVDEWRDTPVRFRYVHGGFKGTDAFFSMYFPPKEQYQGRFFQPISATSGNDRGSLTQAERSKPGDNTAIGFAFASGAYLVESNLG